MNKIDVESHAALRKLLADLVAEPVENSFKGVLAPQLDEVRNIVGLMKVSQDGMLKEFKSLAGEFDDFSEKTNNEIKSLQNAIVNKDIFSDLVAVTVERLLEKLLVPPLANVRADISLLKGSQDQIRKDLHGLRVELDGFREGTDWVLKSLQESTVTEEILADVHDVAARLNTLERHVSELRAAFDAESTRARKEAITGNSANALAELRLLKRQLYFFMLALFLIMTMCFGYFVP